MGKTASNRAPTILRVSASMRASAEELRSSGASNGTASPSRDSVASAAAAMDLTVVWTVWLASQSMIWTGGFVQPSVHGLSSGRGRFRSLSLSSQLAAPPTAHATDTNAHERKVRRQTHRHVAHSRASHAPSADSFERKRSTPTGARAPGPPAHVRPRPAPDPALLRSVAAPLSAPTLDCAVRVG